MGNSFCKKLQLAINNLQKPEQTPMNINYKPKFNHRLTSSLSQDYIVPAVTQFSNENYLIGITYSTTHSYYNYRFSNGVSTNYDFMGRE